MGPEGKAAFEAWLVALEQRHQSDLTFAEVRRAVQALSARYIGGRSRLGEAFTGAGKRAAYAMYFSPLHFLTVRRIVRETRLSKRGPGKLLDLGCGTGVAGAAWAVEARTGIRLNGIDRSGWAVGEARWNWRQFRLEGQVRRGDLRREGLPGRGSAIVAAYSVNELSDEVRDALLRKLLDAAADGARILIVEPISNRINPWWRRWSDAFEKAGGRSDRWRFPGDLPASLERFDWAAGLDHRELTAKSLTIGSPASRTKDRAEDQGHGERRSTPDESNPSEPDPPQPSSRGWIR